LLEKVLDKVAKLLLGRGKLQKDHKSHYFVLTNQSD